jgi:hypothetical protein
MMTKIYLALLVAVVVLSMLVAASWINQPLSAGVDAQIPTNQLIQGRRQCTVLGNSQGACAEDSLSDNFKVEETETYEDEGGGGGEGKDEDEGAEGEEEDPMLMQMPSVDFKAYRRADISSFYQQEPGSRIEQQPAFQGQAGKFVNMSPDTLELTW